MTVEPRWPVPRGWGWTSVETIADVTGGGTPSANDPLNFSNDVGIPWLTPADLTGYEDTYIGRGKRNLSDRGYTSSSAKLLPAGAVLFTSRAPIGYCAIAANPISTNQGFKSLTLFGGISGEFTRHYLKWSKPFLESLASGTTFLELSGSKLQQVPFPLPPLAEQKRIVAKLDALSTKSARARTELSRIETLVSRYKQAVLSKAFSGELTREWRQANSTKWPWKTELWANCGETLNGRAFPSNDYGSSGVKLLRPGNLGPDGKTFWTEKNTRHLPERYARAFPKHFIKGEAILINLTAQSLEDQFLGRACLSSPSDEFMLNQRIGLFRPKNMTNRFCLFALKSAGFRSFVDNGMNSGSLIQHIHTKQLEQYSFLVPDLAEQHEIVRRIESAFAKIDRLTVEAKRALKLLGRLDEAILAKAFRGELVPQDENDEPAEKLLERIRAERDAAPKATRRTRNASVRLDIKRRTTEMAKMRVDVEKDHLAQILRDNDGTNSPTDLWLQSGMDIDEFYKQLRAEIDTGHIREGGDKDQLVLIDAR